MLKQLSWLAFALCSSGCVSYQLSWLHPEKGEVPYDSLLVEQAKHDCRAKYVGEGIVVDNLTITSAEQLKQQIQAYRSWRSQARGQLQAINAGLAVSGNASVSNAINTPPQFKETALYDEFVNLCFKQSG
jgi:hypothetical protein